MKSQSKLLISVNPWISISVNHQNNDKCLFYSRRAIKSAVLGEWY